MEKRTKNLMFRPLKYIAAMALGAFLYNQYEKSDVSSRVISELHGVKTKIVQELSGFADRYRQEPQIYITQENDSVAEQTLPEADAIETLEQNKPEENSIEAIVSREVAKFNEDNEYEHKLNKNLIMAVIEQESKFNPYAVSKAGAKGLMQIMPITQEDCNMNGITVNDIFNPEENIGCGTQYFGRLLNRYGGDVQLALAAYNAGPSNVDGEMPNFPETKNYVKKVMAKFAAYGKGIEEDKMPRLAAKVAKAENKPLESKQTIEHIVKDGENLYRICTKYGVWDRCDEIADANGLKSMDAVKPGKVITIAHNK